jgi:DNA-damage-inducible protein J
MNTTVINIRTEAELKEEAKKIAGDLGMSLSTVINVFLKQFVRRRGLSVSLKETPSDFLKEKMKESKMELKEGKVSPTFDNASDAIEWLNR